MKTQIKTLTLCVATLAAATVAGAYNRPGQERPNGKPAGFKCPVCESPCINKAALKQQVRQHRLQNQDGPRFQRNAQAGSAHPRWQGGQERTSQRPQQQARRQQTGRFDIDGDGQLSHAEKAARRAYRDAMDRNQGVQGNERPDPRPPVE